MYFNYVRGLQFDENPDYTYLKNLFITLMKKNNIVYDYKYDWCINKVNLCIGDKFVNR